MITDVRFLQKYNEVLLDNFNAVLKQNLLFQTNVAVLEEQVKTVSDYDDIKNQMSVIIKENNDLKNELKNKDQRLQNVSNVDTEKHRLQNELNVQYKQISTLNSSLEEKEIQIATLNSSLEEKNKYIEQLENMLPKTKRQKLGLPVSDDSSLYAVIGVEETISDENTSVESAGGTF